MRGKPPPQLSKNTQNYAYTEIVIYEPSLRAHISMITTGGGNKTAATATALTI